MHWKDGSIGFCMCFKCRSCSIVQVSRLVGEKTAVDNRDIYILQLPRHIHTTTSCKMPAKPPIYKSEQLEKYLQRIHYGDSTDPDPEHSRLSQLQQHVQKEPLNAVAELQRRHLCSIPWGNSALHYSQHHSISVHPESIFEKLVVSSRDGYCMETTNLLYGMLQSLGLQVYPSAGRVSNQVSTGNNDGSYQQVYVLFYFYFYVVVSKILTSCRSHMVLIITINGEKYMVWIHDLQ